MCEEAAGELCTVMHVYMRVCMYVCVYMYECVCVGYGVDVCKEASGALCTVRYVCVYVCKHLNIGMGYERDFCEKRRASCG